MDENTKYDKMLIADAEYTTILTEKFKNRKPYKHPKPGILTAFIPGTIVDIHVKKGDKVEEGEILLILEAMKMRNQVQSPFEGEVVEVHVKQGQIVAKNALLIEVK
jgi:biotin carboxyl carrier protein